MVLRREKRICFIRGLKELPGIRNKSSIKVLIALAESGRVMGLIDKQSICGFSTIKSSTHKEKIRQHISKNRKEVPKKTCIILVHKEKCYTVYLPDLNTYHVDQRKWYRFMQQKCNPSRLYMKWREIGVAKPTTPKSGENRWFQVCLLQKYYLSSLNDEDPCAFPWGVETPPAN